MQIEYAKKKKKKLKYIQLFILFKSDLHFSIFFDYIILKYNPNNDYTGKHVLFKI